MKKQSSVEWFASRLLSELGLTIEDTKTNNPKLYDLIDQSKQMHKQETVDFARECLNKAKETDILTSFMNVEHYYKKHV